MGHIRTTTVSSSNLQKLSYVDDTKIMTVYFNNGGEYAYLDVNAGEYEGIVNADSVGKQFNLWLRSYNNGTTINLKKQDIIEAIRTLKDKGADPFAIEILELLGVKSD